MWSQKFILTILLTPSRSFHFKYKGTPPKGGHALVTSIALARSCSYPSEVPAAITQKPGSGMKVDVVLERVVVFFKTSGCAVGSGAGEPIVLLGTVDQEAGPAEVCRETEKLVDALLKHALDSSRVFGEVQEILMSEDRCHKVNDGVDIGRHFTECLTTGLEFRISSRV